MYIYFLYLKLQNQTLTTKKQRQFLPYPKGIGVSLPTTTMKGLTVSDIWNNAIISRKEREMKTRDYCYASEMGYPLIDRWYKMRSEKPTNPPNDRAKRKFFAGNLYEWIVWNVFNLSGLLINKQEDVWMKDGDIPVKGRLDFIVGGTPNFSNAKKEIDSMPMPEEMKQFFETVLEQMEAFYIGEYYQSVKEIKSVSTFMFDKIEKKGAIRQHELQLLHYQMGTGIERGGIAYICRDDARLKEYDLNDAESLKSQYYAELTDLSGYLKSGERPPVEPLILWDGRFSKNLGVEYSNYLKLIYGFETPEDYRNVVDSKIARWNRVLKRVQNGDKMTDKNKIVLDELSESGYNPAELVSKLDDIPEDETTSS